ncbi:hypothetical protein CKO28_20090 [Rhodovibrio sodomensis]|uniref:EfeO-type cupredoxin-like domain-containing protein n=1 Tax=Rhodovibrio sodomensis TaxID=1088 RepID=A0ABS1DK79_9PROT|nr:cupredoxin domain-containing protein [Rhodovibrio sodomensis]MBK1670327.1 hypothetical protein [Rhodovibrio sodomensis]
MTRIWGALAAVVLLAACGGEDAAVQVSQKNKSFNPNQVKIAVGETIALSNDDKRTHNIRVFHPEMNFNSGSQDPGEVVRLTFDAPGTYYVTCGIHPQMELKVTVTEKGSPSGS